jgi:shikimate dehydrogenase
LRPTSMTRLCGLIGDPVEHSISPQMLNSAFESLNLDYVYVAMKVKKTELANAINGVRALGLHGLNITIPHKVEVMKHIDSADKLALEIGAVNTILNRNGRLFGFNTDGIGAVRAIEESGTSLEGKKVVLVGSGGAARAIAFSISRRIDGLTILNRRVERARGLALDLMKKRKSKVIFGGLSEQTLRRELSNARILINATSVGMFPSISRSVVDSSLLRKDLTVFDIVYNPLETRLLREASSVGARTVNGIGMLVHQGAEAFRLWTGKDAPVEHMRKVALKELSRVEPKA